MNAIQHYEHQGFEVVAFLPVWCLEGNRNGEMRAIRHELLVPFKERGILVLTPARMDDDMWAKTEYSYIMMKTHLNSRFFSPIE